MEEGNKVVRTLQKKCHCDLLQENKEIGVTKENTNNNNRKIERMYVCLCMFLIQLSYTEEEGMQAHSKFVSFILTQK